ncbi:MAG: thioredoxin family protein [bacterium]
MKNKFTVLTLTNENFNQRVLESVLPVLVLFCASWSGSSDIMVAILEELARDFPGKAVFAKIDADEAHEIARQFRIASIPTVLFFKQGVVDDRIVGVTSKNDLAQRLRALTDL